MRILTVHNRYKTRGGEDVSRESEDRLLESRGHEIRQVVFDNQQIRERHPMCVGLQASWSPGASRLIEAFVKDWRPDILDVHNFFPLGSPAIHHAGKRLGIPVVQTLHNYRLLCPGATFYHNGCVCEACAKFPLPLPSLVRRCYHGSLLHTGAVSLMVSLHRILRTWQNAVSLFIAVSEFEKQKFVESGFPKSRIFVKPNFVIDAGGAGSGGEEFLFVGRLAPEKGILTMLRAMESAVPARLNIVGDGPLQGYVREVALRNSRVRYLGRRPQDEVLGLMASSRCLVFPSEWYETFGRVAAESFARGTPVIASRIGAVAEIVDDERTGFHFTAGDPNDLARVMIKACKQHEGLTDMRTACRREYEAKYTPERNYELLMSAYTTAMANL